MAVLPLRSTFSNVGVEVVAEVVDVVVLRRLMPLALPASRGRLTLVIGVGGGSRRPQSGFPSLVDVPEWFFVARRRSVVEALIWAHNLSRGAAVERTHP